MRILLLTLACLSLLAASVASSSDTYPIYGVGHVIVRPASENDVKAAIETARRCRDAGLNHVGLHGPLLFTSTDLSPRVKPLVDSIHKMGLTTSFTIDTFSDRSKGSRRYAWKDWQNKHVGDERFCMVASRKTRVPEIKKCIEKGIEAGFDGVFLDFLDWGTEYQRICFCDACVKEFNASVGAEYKRESLAKALAVGEDTIDRWSQWRTKVRNDIARELVEYARKTAAKQKRPFWVAQIAGGIGTEPEFCGSIFPIHAPTTYLWPPDQITRACQSWKRRTPKESEVIALLKADVPGGELKSLAQAAASGGADGWIFIPADKITGDWKALAEARKSSSPNP